MHIPVAEYVLAQHYTVLIEIPKFIAISLLDISSLISAHMALI